MQSIQRRDYQVCRHTNSKAEDGLAIVAIGNALRVEDGIASSLCNALPQVIRQDPCMFDLGPHTGYLSACISGHKAAIIIDSTQNGTQPGTVSILDLGAMLQRATPMNISSCHGFSLANELRLARKNGTLPGRLIFFGVEVDDVCWNENLSDTLKAQLPQLVNNLSFLVGKVVETLKSDA